MAGESAREAARRQREKAERLQRSAELWERGADGEQATAEALSALPREHWTVFHDVHWPGRRYANIDHVAVGPGGVFVIDSKNWTGSIAVRDHVLRQNGRSRETTVAAAADAAIAVAAITASVPPQQVQSVLCFVRDEPVTGWARDVIVCTTGNIAQMLLTRPSVLDEAQVRQAALELDISLREATAPALPALPRFVPVSRKKPATRTKPATRRRRSRSPVPPLLVAAVLFAIVYITPLRTAAIDGLTGLIVPSVSEDDRTPDPTPSDGPEKPESPKKQQQPQP
jgi:hypothetical protein